MCILVALDFNISLNNSLLIFVNYYNDNGKK